MKKEPLTLFDKTQLVEKELIDKLSLWILRIILNLGGGREFLDNDKRFSREQVALFLGVGYYIDMESKKFERSEVMDILKKKYHSLEEQTIFTTSRLLQNNIEQISLLMDLNDIEKEVLEFFVLANQYDVLSNSMEFLGNRLNSTQAKKALSSILNIPLKEINSVFTSTAKLMKSSIVTLNKYDILGLFYKIEVLSDEFADNMLSLDEDISTMIKDSVRVCDRGTLKLEDYVHLSKDIEIVLPYLESALKAKKTGVNILLYGEAGTGKTELAKTLSKVLSTKLFEITYADEDDEAIDGYRRLQAYKTAQALLYNQNIMLMYDEAEDIFDSNSTRQSHKRQENKAWLNRVLESNTIPTIWITNNIYSIDNAMVRRFDFALEVPIPNKKTRAKILKNYSNGLLDEKSITLLSQHENIAPALISRATKVISSIDPHDKVKAFTQVLNNTLKAQGYNAIDENFKPLLPNVYDPKFINTSTNLETLTKGIQKHQNARLCLYGPAGTGKSAFGRYIAQTLDKPLLLKKGSDLISKWVGETEQNIAKAFEEAKEEKAVLVFDEVDGFLAERNSAKQSWEITQVNEMLVQMENFDGIFIATTNLIDNLDKASLRRFDLKLKFDFLTPAQSWSIFKRYAKELKLATPSTSFKKAVQNLNHLTAGDFATVVRQNRFRPIENIKEFIKRLEEEVEIKNVSEGKVMGFVV